MRTTMLAIALAMTTACSDSTTGPADQVYVALHVSHPELRIDDLTTVQVTVTNLGRRPVVVIAGGCPAWFVVLAGSVPVAPGVTICSAITSDRMLAPGESISHTGAWNGRTSLDPSAAAIALAPGAYAMEGRVRVDGHEIRSTSVPIRLLP